MILIYFLLLISLIKGVIFFSKKYGYYDHPDDILKKHGNPTPKSGGIYFFVGIVLLLVVFKPISIINYFEDPTYIYVYVYAFLNLLIGILDDSHSFTPIKKMILQSLITGIVLLLVYFESETNVSYLLLPFLFIGLIFQTNSLNIIDHYNGLSTLTYLYSILFMNYFYPEKILLPNSTPTILLFLTFLYFNLREKGKAKIFQGNGGSHFFGGLLSIIFAKILLETKDLYNFLAVLSTGFVIFFPSLLDTLQVIFSRIGLKLNPLKGSNHHISHRIDIYTSNSVFKTIGIITTIILLPVTIFFYLDFNSSRLVSILFMVAILFVMTIWFASKNIKENISGDK